MERLLALPLLLALALAVTPAQAEHTTDASGCGLSVDAAGTASPNVVDPAGDWHGALGDPDNPGLGDVFREGTDITGAWLHRDAEGLHAVVRVAHLSTMQPNAFFYFLWQYPDDDGIAPNRSTRWVLARLRGYAPAVFDYGYRASGVTRTQYFPEGETTGTITPGVDGTISIDVPIEQMGNPPAGEWLTDIEVEANILVGSAESLPQPSPLRHGVFRAADTTANHLVQCDARV